MCMTVFRASTAQARNAPRDRMSMLNEGCPPGATWPAYRDIGGMQLQLLQISLTWICWASTCSWSSRMSSRKGLSSGHGQPQGNWPRRVGHSVRAT